MAKSKRVKAYIEEQSGQKPGKKSSRGKSIFLALIVLILLGLGASLASWHFMQQEFVRPGPLGEARVFSVTQGSGTSSIAEKLEREGLIKNADLFKLLVKLEEAETGLKAGEYAIGSGASLRDIYETLSDGKAILYPFTAPEGLTSAQIMRAMSTIGTLEDDNPPIPAEGTLLPETYMTPRGMTRSALIEKMQNAQREVIDTLWETRQADLPITTKREAIILASIVEKETGISGERDKVAGVFINRLRRGMRLESDPTIIYGITGGEPLGRGIRRSEIDGKTDWNTYQIDGLPKTAICNPGKEAIAAVLNPAETEAIFFVADGTGGHIFARTLREHNNNVANWRKIERERKRKAAQSRSQ